MQIEEHMVGPAGVTCAWGKYSVRKTPELFVICRALAIRDRVKGHV